MDIFAGIFIAVISVLVTIYLQRLKKEQKQKKIKSSYGKKVEQDSSSILDDHSKEFNKKEILKVGDNIFVAIGYGLANSIMIEGDDGVVIIDTLESCEVAKEVKEEFAKITSKPIVGIILTHFHADHTNGTSEFIAGREDEIEIFGHETLPHYLSQVMDVRSPITYKRAVRQFGMEIPKDALKNAGIGLNLKIDGMSTVSYVYPTKTFSDKMTVNLAGLELELIHAPGETNDQIIIWYKEKKTLFPADNIYQAFPNLYAIRGCMHRDTLLWVGALDKMLALSPDILVPQHTRPVEGRETVKEIVTAYRDAIQYVHDQTVRYMNKGLSGLEIAKIVKLPPHLINHPYLIEFYGTVEWSVRAVYHGYIGWFSGRPQDLHPLAISEEAELMVELAGGIEELMQKAKNAVEAENYQWGLKLTDVLVDSGKSSDQVRELRGTCLRKLALREVSAPGMNWYITEDLVQEGLEIKPSAKARAQRIKAGETRSLFNMLTCMLDAEATLDVNTTACFKFTDTKEEVSVVIRRGICFLPLCTPDQVDMVVVTTSKVWREVMAKERTAVAAGITGEISVNTGIKQLGKFFDYFDTDV
eukprot:GFUD01022616.1.p1 GENE.GFUD01022616.1~~GFUD01022616.1.p1  ORF type:complete len:586 (-),score=145.47 GFUD01022616.1:72-1829(-)